MNFGTVGQNDYTTNTDNDRIRHENLVGGNSSGTIGSAPASLETADPLDPSENYAAIIRDQWQDYVDRFGPLEDMANDMLLDPARRRETRAEFASAATSEVNNAFDRAENRTETLYSRSNQRRTARQQKATDRTNLLERTAATVSARNASRDYADDLESSLLGI